MAIVKVCQRLFWDRAGLPVVATNHAGIPEIIRDQETGFLVPENDPDSLAAALLAVMQPGIIFSKWRSMHKTACNKMPLKSCNAVFLAASGLTCCRIGRYKPVWLQSDMY